MKIEKLAPAFQGYLWGGTKLRDVYGKRCDLEKVAESWELSTHPAGESRIAGGEFDGLTLSEYFRNAGEDVLGEHCREFQSFPVLIKLIDAKDALSVQVHPSDEYALRAEGEYGKTEMWYVVDCEPGAYLYFGVEREISREEFRRRIQDNTVTEVLHRADVHPGDVFFIPSGTIHAIGAGILICEIQQNSNCTYRVYDYDRRGADGKPRELHAEKALAVAELSPSDTADRQGAARAVPGGAVTRLASCRYFTAEKVEVETEVTMEAGTESFLSLMITEGAGAVSGPENEMDFKAGDSLFVPAGSGEITVTGPCTLIRTTV